MEALVLWADDASPNLGVRVLAVGSAALLDRAWPGINVTFQNFGQRRPQLPLGRTRSLIKERLIGSRGMQKWFGSFDVIIDTRAGDSFADIYGLKRHLTMTLVSEFAAQSGTPVVMGPQTIGPFDTRRGRLLAKRSLATASLVMARDGASADYAEAEGRPCDVLTTDVVFALPVPSVPKTRDVVLNVSGLLWDDNPHVPAATYRAVVSDLYDRLTAEGREVSLLAHVLGAAGHDNDIPAVDQFAASKGSDVEVIIPSDVDSVRAAVASAQLVFGSRMHACLNALSVGTPAVPLAYSRKFEPLLDALGWDAVVDLRTDKEAAASAMSKGSQPDLLEKARAVRARADETLALADAALRRLE